MSYTDNSNNLKSNPKKEVGNNPKNCLSWDNPKCVHDAYKGADCPQDWGCILWRKSNIPKCIDCSDKIIKGNKLFDKDKVGPYCSLCFGRLPKELREVEG